MNYNEFFINVYDENCACDCFSCDASCHCESGGSDGDACNWGG